MEISKAELEQLDNIMKFLRKCIGSMHENGINQWDYEYPSKDLIKNDIDSGSLYILVENENILGMVVLSEEQEKEYEYVDWMDKLGRPLIVHRVLVHPERQRQGLGRKLMEFGERFAVENNYTSIRFDTFSRNPSAQLFYTNLGYKRIPGQINLTYREEPYYCYEKILK